MRCSRALKLAIRHEDGEQPSAVTLHLSGCPACREQLARLQSVWKLVSLKKHEQPDAGFEQRSLLAIHRRLAELNETSRGAAAWNGAAGFPLPALRYVIVGTFAALVALQILSFPPSPVSSPPREPVAQVPATVPARTSEIAPSPMLATPSLAAIPVASNRGPGHVEYGPSYLQTLPVRFDY